MSNPVANPSQPVNQPTPPAQNPAQAAQGGSTAGDSSTGNSAADSLDAEQLGVGISMEMDMHGIKDVSVAKEVAKKNLADDSDYYKKLAEAKSTAASAATSGEPAMGTGVPDIDLNDPMAGNGNADLNDPLNAGLQPQLNLTPMLPDTPLSVFGNDAYLFLFGV